MLSEKSKNFDSKSNPNKSEPNQSKPNQSNRNFLKSPRAPWSYFFCFKGGVSSRHLHPESDTSQEQVWSQNLTLDPQRHVRQHCVSYSHRCQMLSLKLCTNEARVSPGETPLSVLRSSLLLFPHCAHAETRFLKEES